MSAQPLAVQEVAGRVATTDKQATADLILDVEVKRAAEVLARKVATPEYRLADDDQVVEYPGC